MSRDFGLVLVGLGAAAILVGLIAVAGGLSWFGRLPGDIRYEGGNVRVYVPLASMLLVSVVASVMLAVLRRLM